MKLTHPLKYCFGLYNIIKQQNLTIGTFLPLYKSNVFKYDDLNACLEDPIAAQRYKQLLPSAIFSSIGIHHKKYLVTQLTFNPEALALRILSLRPRGFLLQHFHVDNIVPWGYRDMMAASNWPQPTLPYFLDSDLVYLNKIVHQALIFQNDGVWNEETINHPQLSIEKRLDEKQWFDRRHII